MLIILDLKERGLAQLARVPVKNFNCRPSIEQFWWLKTIVANYIVLQSAPLPVGEVVLVENIFYLSLYSPNSAVIEKSVELLLLMGLKWTEEGKQVHCYAKRCPNSFTLRY